MSEKCLLSRIYFSSLIGKTGAPLRETFMCWLVFIKGFIWWKICKILLSQKPVKTPNISQNVPLVTYGNDEYRFSQKLKKQKNTNILTVQCLLGGHVDHSTKLFSNHKRCYDSKWPLTSRCFKHWCIYL